MPTLRKTVETVRVIPSPSPPRFVRPNMFGVRALIRRAPKRYTSFIRRTPDTGLSWFPMRFNSIDDRQRSCPSSGFEYYWTARIFRIGGRQTHDFYTVKIQRELLLLLLQLLDRRHETEWEMVTNARVIVRRGAAYFSNGIQNGGPRI